MSQIIHAPNPVSWSSVGQSIFLAGSIEMGKAEDWQSRLISSISHLDVTILNPRRPDWDSSWTQTKDNPQFREQVEWELDGLDNVNVIALYLSPGTMSPISLLELGLYANAQIVVCCPPGFWRKGNVDIVCERYGIPVYEDFESFSQAIVKILS